MFDYLVAGAGFAGCVIAERLAKVLGFRVLLIDKRPHIGGNAYDYYDHDGLLIHKYGPHIFHTNSLQVFEYLSQFTEWRAYQHRVLASVDGHVHYYRYEPTRAWRLWLPATPLARWTRVPRRLAHDGSARPMWLAMREALLRGAVEVLHPPVEEGTRFGVRIEVHAAARGPRSASAISEALIDGALCAL